MALKVILTAKGGRGFTTQLDRWVINLRTMGPAFEAVADYQAKDWQKQFTSQGAYYGARWAPLSPGYRAWKAVHFPGRPILVRTGRLRKSLTERPLGIEQMTSKGIRLGTDVPYGVFHQRGTKFMPKRQLYATQGSASRSRAIAKIMQTYITTGRVTRT